MALSDDLEALTGRKPANFDAWLNTAAPEDAEKVLSYVTNPGIDINPLVETLRRNNIPITYGTVRRYRGAR